MLEERITARVQTVAVVCALLAVGACFPALLHACAGLAAGLVVGHVRMEKSW